MPIVGAGIIGLEMATVYHELGARVTVELMDQITPGADSDVVAPLLKQISKQYDAIYRTTKVAEVQPGAHRLRVDFEGAGAQTSDVFDTIRVAVGRTPNGTVGMATEAFGGTFTHLYLPIRK